MLTVFQVFIESDIVHTRQICAKAWVQVCDRMLRCFFQTFFDVLSVKKSVSKLEKKKIKTFRENEEFVAKLPITQRQAVGVAQAKIDIDFDAMARKFISNLNCWYVPH